MQKEAEDMRAASDMWRDSTTGEVYRTETHREVKAHDSLTSIQEYVKKTSENDVVRVKTSTNHLDAIGDTAVAREQVRVQQTRRRSMRGRRRLLRRRRIERSARR